MKILISMLLLIPVALIKGILVILGLPIVWIKLKRDMDMSEGLYQIGIGRPYTYWEAAIRNPVGGFGWLLDHPPASEVKTYGEVREPGDTKKVPRLQWRFRHHRYLCSVRLLWIYPRRKYYGELYIGWKLLSAPPELDFALSPRFWATVGN